MRIYKLKTIKRLRKKNLPACELMSQIDYDEWMTEQVVCYKRAKEITADLMFGIARGIRSAVAFVCQKHDLLCYFDDVLNDVMLLLLDKWLFRYDPVRSRITYYLSFVGYFCAVKCVSKYHTEHMQDEYWHEVISPEPTETFIIEDFLFGTLPKLKWRMAPQVCSWISLFVLAGVQKKTVMKALHDTIYENRPHRANTFYDYTLVTLRIELDRQLERQTGGVLPE